MVHFLILQKFNLYKEDNRRRRKKNKWRPSFFFMGDFLWLLQSYYGGVIILGVADRKHQMEHWKTWFKKYRQGTNFKNISLGCNQ